MADVARWREEEAQQREEELGAQRKREIEAEQKRQEDEAWEARRWAMQLRRENSVEWDRLYSLAREGNSRWQLLQSRTYSYRSKQKPCHKTLTQTTPISAPKSNRRIQPPQQLSAKSLGKVN
jgi:hypothetical protein